jgi:hypothetical protein
MCKSLVIISVWSDGSFFPSPHIVHYELDPVLRLLTSFLLGSRLCFFHLLFLSIHWTYVNRPWHFSINVGSIDHVYILFQSLKPLTSTMHPEKLKVPKRYHLACMHGYVVLCVFRRRSLCSSIISLFLFPWKRLHICIYRYVRRARKSLFCFAFPGKICRGLTTW